MPKSPCLLLVLFAACSVCCLFCLLQSKGFVPRVLGLWLNQKNAFASGKTDERVFVFLNELPRYVPSVRSEMGMRKHVLFPLTQGRFCTLSHRLVRIFQCQLQSLFGHSRSGTNLAQRLCHFQPNLRVH